MNSIFQFHLLNSNTHNPFQINYVKHNINTVLYKSSVVKKSRKWMIKQKRSEANPVVESANHDTLFCLNWVKQSELFILQQHSDGAM